MHFYAVGDEVVWGATGRVVAQFLQAVFGVPVLDGGDGQAVLPT